MKKDITSFVCFVLLLLIALINIQVFKVVVLFLSLWCLHFFHKFHKLPITMKIVDYFCLLYIFIYNMNNYIDLKLMGFILVIYMVFILLINNNKKYSVIDAFGCFGTVAFIGMFSIFLKVEKKALICLLIMFCAMKVYEYIANKLIGKHKINDTTIEGISAGIFFGVFLSSIYYLNVFDYTSSVKVIGFSLLIVVCSTVYHQIMNYISDYFGIEETPFYVYLYDLLGIVICYTALGGIL